MEASTDKRKLTDRYLASVKGAAAPYDIRDTEVPGLRVRVMPSGERSFVLLARFTRDGHPTRRAIGSYPIMTLADARATAIEWKRQIGAGIDPVAEAERRHREAERKQAGSFAAVAEAFIKHCHDKKLRTAALMEHDLRKTFITAWGSRPITDIQPEHIKHIIRQAADRGAKYQAHSDFTLIRRVFNWSRGNLILQNNPCDPLSPTDLIGAREPREHILTDAELRAFWCAAGRMKYPHHQLYKLLVLTGLRLGEVCGARWSEFDLEKRVWVIPAARMKKTRSGAKPFMVPLTVAMMDVLQDKDFPHFNSGDCLFSFTFGKTPVQPHSFSNVKEQLDTLMREELDGSLSDFVNHDIRRTVRSHLSALRIAEEVREAVLAHTRGGIKRVYDQHDYLAEKLEALTLWNARLRSIVDPPPANVVKGRFARA
jgi:integrase